MVEAKYGGWIQKWVCSSLHQMLGWRTPQVNGQGQIVQSGNNNYTLMKVAFIGEDKKKHRKIVMVVWHMTPHYQHDGYHNDLYQTYIHINFKWFL